MFLLAQIFWAIGLILELITFQFKNRKTILVLLMFWTVFWAIHFYFLNELVSAWILVWSALRLLVAFLLDKDWKYFTLSKYFFFISLFLITIFLYKSYIDFIVLFAWLTAVISSFQKKDKLLRIWAMVSTFAWLVISILVWTPISIVASTTFLISNIIGYWRFYWNKKSHGKK